MSKDLSSPYNTGFLNEKSFSFRLSGDKLNEFLSNLESVLSGRAKDEGIQITCSLNTKNDGKSYFGGAFLKTYLDDYKPKGGSDWKSKSNASKERGRIKEHSIDGGNGADQKVETRSGTSRGSSRFSGR